MSAKEVDEDGDLTFSKPEEPLNPNPPSKRTVRLNREVLLKHRIMKGWTQDNLSRKAGFSQRTLARAEMGYPLYYNTAVIIAEALGVDLDDLLVHPEADASTSSGLKLAGLPSDSRGGSTDASESSDGKVTFNIELTINKDINEFGDSEQKALLEALRKLLDVGGDLVVRKKHPG